MDLSIRGYLLRKETEFESRHRHQSVWPMAIRYYHSMKKRVAYYGLSIIEEREDRRLYVMGRKLVAQGMTAS